MSFALSGFLPIMSLWNKIFKIVVGWVPDLMAQRGRLQVRRDQASYIVWIHHFFRDLQPLAKDVDPAFQEYEVGPMYGSEFYSLGFLTCLLLFFILPSTPPNTLNPFVFPLVVRFFKGDWISLAPLFLGNYTTGWICFIGIWYGLWAVISLSPSSTISSYFASFLRDSRSSLLLRLFSRRKLFGEVVDRDGVLLFKKARTCQLLISLHFHSISEHFSRWFSRHRGSLLCGCGSVTYLPCFFPVSFISFAKGCFCAPYWCPDNGLSQLSADMAWEKLW